MRVDKLITQAVERQAEGLGLKSDKFTVEHPAMEAHGDYATNLALVVGGNVAENAQKLKEALEVDEELKTVVERMEIAGPGFVNFWLKQTFLVEQMLDVLKVRKEYGRGDWLKDKRVMVEYTDPNPFKEFHIGHLMSNAVGEAIARIMDFNGAMIRRVCYQGDVGMHVAMSVYGLMKKLDEEKIDLAELAKKPLLERVRFLGQGYALGAAAYKGDEVVTKEINQINKQIYDRSDETINELYDQGREWSLEYFETIYKRLGTKFDDYFFESEMGVIGKKLVEEFLERGVFEKSEGAVVFKGENFGLHTRVFLNAIGLPTYEAKELGLVKAKDERWPHDLSISVTGNEITEYFKVLIKAMEQIYPELAAKIKHLPHGMLRLTTGKMSSRTGKVITGESLLGEVREAILERMGDGADEAVADKIAVASIKLSMLKQGVGRDVIFDPQADLAVEGDTGPYLQYALVRAKSVLEKAPKKQVDLGISDEGLSGEEMALLRWIYQFSEEVENAATEYAPNVIAGYLLELARRFNTFYMNNPILTGGDKMAFRLTLTEAVAQVLENGLKLLGIEPVEKM